jgi:hypothetical protein
MRRTPEDFETLEFRSKHPAVYVVGFKNADTFTPFYVGETGNLTCRCADYVRSQFKAQRIFVLEPLSDAWKREDKRLR